MTLVGALMAAIGAVLFVSASRARKRLRAAVAPLSLEGIEGRVVFLSDGACRRCPQVRDALRASGVEFTEVSRDSEPDAFEATGASEVPLVVARDAAGAEVGRIVGPVGRHKLGRLLRRAGITGL